MKKILLFLLFPLLTIAQVGINTTTPNAALDIQSTNNGVLIPRVQLTDALDIVTVVNPAGGALATSTLVYNIVAAGVAPNIVTAGFHFWNGTRWMPIAGNTSSDHDWYEEGTTTPPNAITDAMFHTGNVAIGKNIANYPLDIESSTNSVGINTSISGDFQKKGISSNLVYGSGIQDQTGIESVINSTISSSSNPYIYSFKSSLTNTGQGENYGFHNTVSNINGNATTFGIKNILNTRNNATGTENTINSTGNPLEISGTKNTLFGTNDTTTFGTKNEITQTGNSGDRYGTYNNLTNSFGSNLFGTYNILNTGNTNRYGSYNVINTTGASSGSNYGVYSRVLTSGSENYAGYFLGDVAIGRTDLNKYILPQTRGTNGQIMQTDGAGNVTWQNPTSFGWELDGNTAITTPVSPTTYGTSTIGASENFIGTTDNNDVIVGTNNIERLRVKNTTGNVGIGISNPSSALEINSGGTTELKLSSRGAFGTTRFSMISDKELPDEWRPTYIQSADNGSFTGRMDFFTNGTGIANKFGSLRAMSITNGNVGIGTTNPTKKLDIVAPNNEIGLRLLSGNNSELAYLSIGRTIEYAQIGACITSRFFLDALDGDMAIKNFGAGKILLGASVNTNADMSIVPGGNIGIGTVTPTSKLHIVNTTSGALRIEDGTQANGNVLRSDANGVGTWQNPNSYSWSLTGNTVNAATHFLGSTNNADVIFKRNNIQAGFLGLFNTSFGNGALINYALNLFSFNTAFGRDALAGDSNTALNTGSTNTAVGVSSLSSNTAGDANTGVGYLALSSNKANSGSTAIGFQAMIFADNRSIGRTTANTAVGYNALSGSSVPANNTGIYNTAIGYQSLLKNTSGSYNTAVGFNSLPNNTTGHDNTATGTRALHDTSTGFFNTANGSSALEFNVANSRSTAIGYYALRNADNRTGGRDTFNTAIGCYALLGNANPAINTGQYNSAVGDAVLYSNTSGSNNTGIGSNALYLNTTGSFNTAIGTNAGGSITTAVQNVAIGNNALDSNSISGGNTAVGFDALQATTGDFNTAFGNSSLFNLVAGTSNCAFGYNALTGLTSGINNIGIGTNAVVPLSTGSNQIRMGNNAITYAGIQVAWTITSDKRWKSDIQTSNLGLNFINKLNPVSYIRKNDESKKTEYGFIAQELDQTLNEFGATNSGIITKDDKGMLSVRYNDLLSPMVKAIQELKTENDTLKKQNENLEARLKKIEEKINN